MPDPPEDDLQEFLSDFVESVEDLQILAWFRQLAAGKVATAREIAHATGLQEPTTSEVLERLAAKKLVEVEKEAGAFRYTPPDPSFAAALDAALARYESSSLEVLQMLSANSIERVRLAALRMFTDGLRGRGPKQA